VKEGELQTAASLLGQQVSDGDSTELRLLVGELQGEEREKSKEIKKFCRFSPRCC